MPEFEQEEDRPFQSIAVHFASEADVDRFATLVGQKITSKTRYIWFPEMRKNCYVDKRYVAESEVAV
jgi:hypothetical protein